MMDESDFIDPAQNFTRPENQPMGARLPEYVFYEMLGWSLNRIHDDVDAQPIGLIDELFAMTSPTVIKQVKQFFREQTNIQVSVNWPSEDIHLPIVAVVNKGEQEDSKLTFLGDRAGPMRYGVPPSTSRQTVRSQRAVGVNYNVEVVIGTRDPNLTMYFHHVVKYIFFANKGNLTEKYDIHNLIVGGRDLMLDASLFPTMGYYKAVTLMFTTLFDWNMGEQASSIVDVGLLVQALEDGEVAITAVPGGE